MKIAKICSTRVFAAVLTAGMLVIPAYVATPRALAQTAATGTISGTITDASGAAVPNTTVVITNTDTGASRTVTTNNDGDYSSTFLQPGHYEIVAGGTGNFGINHHTDSGAVTVLLQDDQPGLQVYRRNAWTLVQPNPEALVVNIGDVVQVWSNDRYPAALHRVIASSSAERYSAPFFFNPAPNAHYAPLPGVLGESEPPHYRPINWGEFRRKRADGDFADYGSEIQISDYRISAP